jgi:hypothetical protein
VTAVGLERRTTNGSEHLPSDRPEPCGPGRLGHACCSRAQLRLAPCCLPRSEACLVKDWLVASNYPALLRSPRLLATTAFMTRKMRLTDFCNRLDYTSTLRTARFLATPSCYGMPRDTSRLRAPTHPGPRATRLRGWDLASAYQVSQPSGASLDGEPPASASAAIRPARFEVGASNAHVIQTPRGPGGAPIDCSSAPCLPIAVFSTADRACDVASGVLSHGPPRTWSCDRVPFASSRWIHLHRRLVKDVDLAGSGHLPSTSSPSPGASRAFAFAAWDHGEPVTGLAARVLMALATAIRLPALLRPLSLP